MIGFAHPWILAALAAAGLPVLIHFLTRARPRTIRYPTYHLLVEAGSGRQALHRLRTWAILALRTLLVAALALAFAKPFVASTLSAPEGGAARRAVLLVDASLSLRAVDRGVALFTKAQAQAADLLRTLDAGSAAAAILFGSRPVPILPALSRNLAALHEGLAAARPTLERGDPAAALALAARLLEGQGEIFVFSDFQRTNWAPVDFAGLQGIQVFLRPVAERAVDNVGITAVEKSPEEPIEGETIELAATLFNSTAHKRRERVRLDLEGVSQSIEVELQPYSSGQGTFTFSLPRAGTYPGKVSIGGDDLGDDDRRFFKVDVRQALRVLLVSDAAPRDASSAAHLVATALSPSEYAATGIQVIRRLSQDVDRGSLETADAFFLVPPVRPTGETVEIVARRVSEGAQLVCFLDGPAAPSVLGAIAGAQGGAAAPPFRLARQVAATDGGQPFGEAETSSGPLRLFQSPQEADLQGLRFLRHYLTEDDAARKQEVLARFEDGSAALSLSPAGRGMAVFANFPVSPDGSNLAGSPLFPALLHELLRSLRRSGAAAENHPGEPWTLDCAEAGPPSGEEPRAFRVRGPGGEEIEGAVVSRGRFARLALPPPRSPGHYAALRGDAPAGLGVVNVHPRETDTRPLDLKGLLEGGGPRGASIALLDSAGEIVGAGRPLELWPACVAAAAAAVALEMALLAFWRKKPRPVPRIAVEARAP